MPQYVMAWLDESDRLHKADTPPFPPRPQNYQSCMRYLRCLPPHVLSLCCGWRRFSRIGVMFGLQNIPWICKAHKYGHQARYAHQPTIAITMAYMA